MAHVVARIDPASLDVSAAVAAASAADCGAIAVFVGTVRATAAAGGREDKAVVRLEYDAHPTLAGERLVELAGQAAARWGLRRVTAVHRTGRCEVGEPSVVVACGAPHRAEALDACRWLIDQIKSTVPIWKREVYADGSSWVGAEGVPATTAGTGP